MNERTLTTRLNALTAADGKHLVHEGRLIGIEKESLRVSYSGGMLAKTPHPLTLGSALTHPYITTDYSEALLEFVVPPSPDASAAREFLHDIHAGVFSYLDKELLWPASMPCIIRTEAEIPLAYYGTSNSGRMKTIYRRGLGYRYGRPMQTIAGVHFNYSFGDSLWAVLRDNGACPEDNMRDFRSRRYMDLLRNTLRLGWVVPYLFGISPAVCRNFLGTTDCSLERFDEATLYGRYATSLRMGDIGYQNNRDAKLGVKASYNSLSEYIASLTHAVTTECDKYRAIGVNVGGEYYQLSACILQIENEYYSSVRPKYPPRRGEMPLAALRYKGISYVELRSLDVNTFEPTGVSLEQLYFLEMLMLFCLLQDSPAIAESDWEETSDNEITVAHEGRRPGLKLVANGSRRLLQQWGLEVCDRMRPVAELMDSESGNDLYRNVLDAQIEKFRHPEACPSAQLLQAMHDSDASFVAFAERQARRFREAFISRPLAQEQQTQFDRVAAQSLRDQAEIEANDTLTLDAYINAYLSQAIE